MQAFLGAKLALEDAATCSETASAARELCKAPRSQLKCVQVELPHTHTGLSTV
jgi:hypothetical protein